MLEDLLELAKQAALAAGARLADGVTPDGATQELATQGREVKARVDFVLEEEILARLRPTGLPILSEESGYQTGSNDSGYLFIVDPLDGTFNYVKRLGPCAISIALWRSGSPVFGVVHELQERRTSWGGAGIGAFTDGIPLSVSSVRDHSQASICTGIPAALDVHEITAFDELNQIVRTFLRVRMIGSAAVSLLNVARGSADAYYEKEIKLWDVAAGIAIVMGAGGRAEWISGVKEHSLHVYAANATLSNLLG